MVAFGYLTELSRKVTTLQTEPLRAFIHTAYKQLQNRHNSVLTTIKNYQVCPIGGVEV